MKHSYICLKAYFLASKKCQAYARSRVDNLDMIDFLSWNQRFFFRRVVESFLGEYLGSPYNARFSRVTKSGKNYYFGSFKIKGVWSYWVSFQLCVVDECY